MKQIVAFVNKWDRKQLEKFTDINIRFTSSLNDFEESLVPNCIPVFSLGLAASNYQKVKKITLTHPDIKFYFLQKRRNGLPVKTNELKLRADENTESQVMLPDEIIALI
jgi:hypothetical protein